MLPDRVSNPGPLTYESGALPIALRGPAQPWIYLDNFFYGKSSWIFKDTLVKKLINIIDLNSATRLN